MPAAVETRSEPEEACILRLHLHRGSLAAVVDLLLNILGVSTIALPTAAFRDTSGGIRLANYASSTLYNAGGIFSSDPGAAQNAAGDTFIAVRDTYNSLWANVFHAATQTWGTWTFGGGLIKGTPAVAVATNGIAYIALRDTWNSYWLTSYTSSGAFGTWNYLGGIFSTDPVIAASPDGSVYIVGKDTFNSLWSRQYIPATGLQAWQFGGGIIKGSPSLTVGTD